MILLQVLVAGGLAAGFSITRRLLGAARGDTSAASGSRSSAAASSSRGRSREVTI